jgi:hypothetical protein
MRKVLATFTLATMMVLGPATAASATHTGNGCEHRATGQAHASVPHRNHGNHQAHSSIPYCPPDDAPRHR